jgi:hypothetical protein
MASFIQTIKGFFRKKKSADQSSAPLKFQRPRGTYGIAKAKFYAVEVAILYDGKPVGRVAMMNKGYRRDKVAEDAQEKLSIKVLSVVQKKK